MIEAIGLTKRFGHRTAIKDVSFRVEQGEILGFLGPNGSGKTTTMRILTGYMPPNAGGATIAGYDVLSETMQARRHLGYLPEQVPLYPEMRVVDYLDYMARIRRIPDRRAAVERAMRLVFIEHQAKNRIAKLSKGYRQRVGLAQALLHDPPVLILDEPTVGLDPRQIIEVRELIRELGATRTIILSTHILPEVSELCHRVVILNEGQIVATDTPAALTNQLQGMGRRVYLHIEHPQPDTLEKIRALEGVLEVHEKQPATFEIQCVHDAALRPKLARLVVEEGWGLLEMRPIGMSMEEIFLKLTTREEHLEAIARSRGMDHQDQQDLAAQRDNRHVVESQQGNHRTMHTSSEHQQQTFRQGEGGS